MHRFYTEERLAAAGQLITLSREESQHAARVLRLRPGEEVRLLDGGALWAATLETVDEQAAQVRVTAECPSPESKTHVTLWQGLPKADKLEWIVQKATELGTWELWPVEMERSVARAGKAERGQKRCERLERIALEAAKQSGRAHVMRIWEPCAFAAALERTQAEKPDLLLVAWEEEHALPLSRAVAEFVRERGLPRRVTVVIGPEGGISPGEQARLKEAGAVSVTLGARILRTETAGLCAMSVLWGALGEM